jgi:hypothetical protein
MLEKREAGEFTHVLGMTCTDKVNRANNTEKHSEIQVEEKNLFALSMK